MTAINGGARDVAATVRESILAVYRDTGRPPLETSAASLLGSDLGLDSLDLAQIIVLLERSLGVDPFRDARATTPHRPIRTVDDLVTLYSDTLSGRS